MAEKYRATIHGSTIEWDGDPPVELDTQREITVEVEALKKPNGARRPSSKRAVAALRQMAERGGVKSIPDPVKWQREIRRDRKLPGS